MRALFLVIDLALEIYIWIVIAAAIFSWLVAFHVVNTRNQVVGMIGEFLYRITEPVLRPIRNLLPKSWRHRRVAGRAVPDHHLHSLCDPALTSCRTSTDHRGWRSVDGGSRMASSSTCG